MTRRKLGTKYPHICGPLIFKSESRLKNEFLPKFFRLLCQTLDITDRDTDDRAVDYNTHTKTNGKEIFKKIFPKKFVIQFLLCYNIDRLKREVRRVGSENFKEKTPTD